MGKGANTKCGSPPIMETLEVESMMAPEERTIDIASAYRKLDSPGQRIGFEEASRGRTQARKIQKDAADEAREKQAEINAAESIEEACLLLNNFDTERIVESVVTNAEKEILFEEFKRSHPSDSPAARARKEREAWPKRKQAMARESRMIPRLWDEENDGPPPALNSLFQSEDFREQRLNYQINYIDSHKRSPTAEAAEHMIKGPLAGLGHAKVDPEKPVAFYWRNPDEDDKLYFIELLPSSRQTDPFDIIINMEDVEGGLNSQHRVSVKAPKAPPIDKDALEDFDNVPIRQERVLMYECHSITKEAMKEPGKLVGIIQSHLLGGGDFLIAGSYENRIGSSEDSDAITLGTVGGIRILDASVRRAIVLAMHDEDFTKQNPFKVDASDPTRVLCSWDVKIRRPGKDDETITLTHPCKYAATKAGRPAMRKGQPIMVDKAEFGWRVASISARLAPRSAQEHIPWSRDET